MRQIILPNRNGTIGQETIEITDSLVILGANGTGKSRLGSIIENHTPQNRAKRISAQRLLNIPDYAPVMSYEQSLQEYIHSWRNRQVIEVQNDYQNVLATIFAKTSRRDQDFVEICKTNESKVQPEIPESAIEKLIRIWNDILPHRKINLFDSKIIVTSPDGQEYSGSQMSDGERVALYLISQCLVVPENYFVIIDEPELHLHKALMSRLWNKIEAERNDCTFIYITHDLDFAASRVKAEKLWVKSFANNIWNWEIVPDSNEIPENILLEIIGSRKPVLFVEGDQGSYDHAIYQFYYSNFTILPRGSGTKVIESTKGINNNEGLHSVKAFGLVDRDYKNQEEIEYLEKNKVFVIDVAEVENLLLIPEIIVIVAEHLALDVDKTLNDVTESVLQFLIDNFEREVSYSTSLEVNYKLNTLNNKRQGSEEIKNAIQELVASINIDEIYKKYELLYRDIIDSKDFKRALRHFNHKGMLPNVSRFFELHGNNYSKLIIRLLKTDKSTIILNALKEYLPEENKYS